MAIEIKTDTSKDLTVFSAVGEIDFNAQMAVLKTFYHGTPTKNVIWDFRSISGSRISPDEISRIIEFIKANEHKRPDGKTALVTSELVDFGLARMSGIMSELRKMTVKLESFKSFDAALDWLGVRSDDG